MKSIVEIYGEKSAAQSERYRALLEKHREIFGQDSAPRFFTAPGRTEISGNHTDHNRGKVLAAAIDLDAICAASANDNGIITFYSEGFAQPFIVDTADLSPRAEEKNTTRALIRGVCAGITESGGKVGGLDCVAESGVMIGSGLSSSAAIEVLICTILDCIYGSGSMDPVRRAQIAQFAENEYFGKPSGLMDQATSSVGGLVKIDFAKESPVVEKVDADFSANGFAVVVVGTGTSHDDLTEHYASIPVEMKSVAKFFRKSVLREVDEAVFMQSIASLRGQVSERAIMRAMHFFAENRRVDKMVAALEEDCISYFLREAIKSGESSWMLLQNIYADPKEQSLALALAMSAFLLAGRGGWRVHGGGFAGTIQAFVPQDLLDNYINEMDGVFGAGACTVLSVREVGAAEVDYRE